MSTQILPAASLRNARRLPAARTRSWASNYLICMVLWSFGRAIFGVASNFLPALRERCRLPGGVEPGADHLRALFPVMISDNSVPAAADRASGGPPREGEANDAGASRVFYGGRAPHTAGHGATRVGAQAGRRLSHVDRRHARARAGAR